MNELDKKIEEIIARCDYSNNSVDPINDPVAVIKQAFKDAGYVNIKEEASKFGSGISTVTYYIHSPANTIGTEILMTGQAWFDRFKKNLDEDGSLLGHDYDRALESAKKAAGLE